jgi:hypothetical protein
VKSWNEQLLEVKKQISLETKEEKITSPKKIPTVGSYKNSSPHNKKATSINESRAPDMVRKTKSKPKKCGKNQKQSFNFKQLLDLPKRISLSTPHEVNVRKIIKPDGQSKYSETLTKPWANQVNKKTVENEINSKSKVRNGKRVSGISKLHLDINEFRRPDRSFITSILTACEVKDVLVPQVNMQCMFGQGELVIGLDFGTAFTKVVVANESYACAVKFNEVGYLLPSIIYFDDKGKASLNSVLNPNIVKELKLPILLEQTLIEDQIAIVCFLGLVFKYVKQWKETSLFASEMRDWVVNAGLPTASAQDDSLHALYRNLIDIAWIISSAEQINIYAVNSLLQQDIRDNSSIAKVRLNSEAITLLPEFIAQIAGYVQSPSRQKYSHFIVDVGAGTLDVALFIVRFVDDEWVYEVYSKSVTPRGVNIFTKYRANNLGVAAEQMDENLTDREMAKKLNISLAKLKEKDCHFAEDIISTMLNVVNQLGPPKVVVENITTFLCGGGANVSMFRSALNQTKDVYKMELRSLVMDDIRLVNKDIDKNEYHRLAVAYGLSFDSDNIGKCKFERLEKLTLSTNKAVEKYSIENNSNRRDLYKS